MPFAALPHDIAGRPDVSPLGKTVLLALLFWARGKDHCWPSDASISARVGRAVGTVQRALRQLEALGLVVREKSDANRTGRLIRLAWLRAGDQSSMSSAREVPTSPARDEGNVIVKREALKDGRNSAPERRRPDEPASASVPIPSPAPPAALAPILAPNSAPSVEVPGLTPPEQARLVELPEPTRARVLELLATGAPVLVKEARRLLTPPAPREPSPESISLADLLASLPGRPDRVATAAGRLARELGDHRSFGFYQSVAAAVCRREVSSEALVMATREGLNPKANRPGAVFATAWKREARIG
jgi:hypothetical protein